jgi:hypothetical protein
VAAIAALAAGMTGAFLLYVARWHAMLAEPGLVDRARRRALVARVLLSVAVSAMLVAIPAHGFFYLWAWPMVCEEFCGLPALLLLFAAGAVALVTGLAGLVLVGAAADLMIFWVGIPLGIVTILVSRWPGSSALTPALPRSPGESVGSRARQAVGPLRPSGPIRRGACSRRARLPRTPAMGSTLGRRRTHQANNAMRSP